MKNPKYDICIETEQDDEEVAWLKGKVLEAKLDDITRWITTVMVLLAGAYVILNIFNNYLNGFISKMEFVSTVAVLSVLLVAKLAVSVKISLIKNELIKRNAL